MKKTYLITTTINGHTYLLEKCDNERDAHTSKEWYELLTFRNVKITEKVE